MFLGSQLGAHRPASCHTGFDISAVVIKEMSHDSLPALIWHVQKTGRERQSKILPYSYIRNVPW